MSENDILDANFIRIWFWGKVLALDRQEGNFESSTEREQIPKIVLLWVLLVYLEKKKILLKSIILKSARINV